jgi:pimeloyl-ACP methyl ester carboxylesterase
MPFADLGDVSLFYTDDGDGPPVLVVHGWTCDSHDWQYQVPALLGAGFRVVAVDLRGHGRSSVPAEGFTARQFAADLAMLLERLGASPAVVVGHSLGGAVAVALAVEHPGAVRAVVPVDAAYGMDRAGVEALSTTLLPALGAPGGHEAALAMFEGFYTAATPPNLPVWHGRRMTGMPLHVLHDVIAGLVTAEDTFSFRPEADAYLARVACPALAFRAGSQDPVAVANWERSCFQHPYSRAVGWEGSGHWLHQERPAEFNALLLEWLAGLPA